MTLIKCDKCETIIPPSSSYYKHIKLFYGFKEKTYDVCDKCYNEIQDLFKDSDLDFNF